MPSNSNTSKHLSTNFLEADYQPNGYSVKCGHGAENFNYVGNRRFRATVQMYRERYAACVTKTEKGRIVSEVIRIIRTSGGEFVKKDRSGEWYAVSEAVVREKVSSAFRDILHGQYSSATKNKNARRLAKDKLKRQTSLEMQQSSTAPTTTAKKSRAVSVMKGDCSGSRHWSPSFQAIHEHLVAMPVSVTNEPLRSPFKTRSSSASHWNLNSIMFDAVEGADNLGLENLLEEESLDFVDDSGIDDAVSRSIAV